MSPNELPFSSELVDTFGGLSTVRPRRLQALLEDGGPVRPERASLVLARHAGHAWYGSLKHIDWTLAKASGSSAREAIWTGSIT
ncbi:type IV toxin-antitoxin system AbiEi family antitoxin domain-containing protein [Halomonas sp. DP8Y7-3]|uniref:type IV toxin-antitoxin system AbiEi family antitoxin domain-containing protein n=1 Tax=Halomonas sp. DP8Y7-3 TaxID=2859079 RepID=UPI0028F7303E|nr:type IV toxin-antitoxin system AbiEi family antitoxin domain-containing protein [Halomonas sp. DP8Y7-3]